MVESSKVTPRIPGGFLELLPDRQRQFNAMLETIRRSYESYGFTPIETPAIELTDVLLAKGGGETDQQVYQVSRFGGNTSQTSEMLLHFDLTVPLARFVAEHKRDIVLPFRRYQMQKVWRAEKPQRGRFNEFYQCDFDIIGATTALYDAEVAAVIYETFRRLDLSSFRISLNNRKLLNGALEAVGLTEEVTPVVLRALDKLGKQDSAVTLGALQDVGLTHDRAVTIIDFVTMVADTDHLFSQLESSVGHQTATYQEGLAELWLVVQSLRQMGVDDENFIIDLSIARGLDYYTGTVYETFLTDYRQVGSVCSGGRFDNLAEHYTDSNMPGVGASIGLTRLFSQLMAERLLPKSAISPSLVMVAVMGESTIPTALRVVARVREWGYNAEIFLDPDVRLRKQLQYAARVGIPLVIILGEDEISSGTSTLKDMRSSEQFDHITQDQLCELLDTRSR